MNDDFTLQFKCEICKFNFAIKMSLSKHIREVHEEENHLNANSAPANILQVNKP